MRVTARGGLGRLSRQELLELLIAQQKAGGAPGAPGREPHASPGARAQKIA